jgi:putative peptidoglycan lipid II flippase
MTFLRSVSSLSLFTVCSRVTGYCRDLLIVYFVGIGATSDALAFALKLPSFFRRMFAEGGFHVSFLPVFTKLLHRSKEEAFDFANNIFVWLFATLCLFLLVVEIFFEPLVCTLFAKLADNPSTLSLVLQFGRVTFPFVFFISMTSFYGSILNAFGKFTLLALSHVFSNISVIFCFLLIALCTSYQNYGFLFASCVFLGGLFQMLFIQVGVRRYDFPLIWQWPTITPALKSFLKKLGPSMLSVGVIQINLLVGIHFASGLAVGGISYLYYADRLNQLPLSIIGVSLSSVLLPLLSQHLQKKELRIANKIQNYAIRFAALLIFPALMLTFSLALPLMYFLFGHGSLRSYDLLQMSYTLQIYGIGLPAYIAIKILNTRFFAEGRTHIPLISSIIGVGSDIILSIILIPYAQHLGIALAISLSAWCQIIFLGTRLYFEKTWHLNSKLKFFLLKIVASCFLSTLWTWKFQSFLPLPWENSWMIQVLFLFFSTLMALTLCIFLMLIMKVFPLRIIRYVWRKKLKTPSPS